MSVTAIRLVRVEKIGHTDHVNADASSPAFINQSFCLTCEI